MELNFYIPRPVAAALLRYQIEYGMTSASAAAAHCLIHFLSQRGYF